MKRYAIEVNARFVADTDNIKTAEKQFSRFREHFPEPNNMIRVWDRETGATYKGFPLNEENEEID